MVSKEQEAISGDKPSEVPSDSELFAEPVQDKGPEPNESLLREADELSESDVFATEEPSHKSSVESDHGRTAVTGTVPWGLLVRHLRPSTIQKVLIAAIIVVAAVLIYELLKPASRPVTRIMTTSWADRSQATGPATDDPIQMVPTEEPSQIDRPESLVQATAATSLEAAETLFRQKDYDNAYAAFGQLDQRLRESSVSEQLLKEFLQLRMALCLRGTLSTGNSMDAKKRADNFDQARHLLRAVQQSRSPALRVVAAYHSSVIQMQKQQYLRARSKACQSIALVDAAEFDTDWAMTLKRECRFLIAEALTRYVLSLSDADKELPRDLWAKYLLPDPFTDLNETELWELLNCGTEQLDKRLLGPKIQKLQHRADSAQSTPPRWLVVCHGTPIEQLLARFAANDDLDLSWAPSTKGPRPQTDSSQAVPVMSGSQLSFGKRPVSMYMMATTARQFLTSAAGCVGLLARLDDTATVSIYNPGDYRSLSEQIALLAEQATGLWQSFLLAFHGDARIANAHLAMGLLHTQTGQINEAIAEYKLVANGFAKASLAACALLESSKLKVDLHDYSGASQDLKQLVEQYPDAELSGPAYLYLAEATMKAGLETEAARLFRKVYNLDFSYESKTAAALGAGKSCYDTKDYESAATWFTRYIDLASGRSSETNKDLYWCYYLLGKTHLALGQAKQACNAFQHALAGKLSKPQYLQTITAIVEAHRQQENLVEALGILETVHPWQFSLEKFTEILLLKAGVLRDMGLGDKAIGILGDRAKYVSAPQLKARTSFELAKCYIAQGELESAHQILNETRLFVEPGGLADLVALELAELCLKLDQDYQTVLICRRLLDSGPPEPTRQQALDLLAAAYKRQKDFESATLALLGQWDRSAPFDQRTTTNETTPQSSHQTEYRQANRLTQ